MCPRHCRAQLTRHKHWQRQQCCNGRKILKHRARSYLCACRIQWDAVEQGDPSATLEDLRWYIASYASVKAGELSQIRTAITPNREAYYLAFFKLVHEDDPLWSRMRGLINPMLSYFWVNAWRELGLSMENPTNGVTSPAEIAIQRQRPMTIRSCANSGLI